MLFFYCEFSELRIVLDPWLKRISFHAKGQFIANLRVQMKTYKAFNRIF